jgi:hypothetical protein
LGLAAGIILYIRPGLLEGIISLAQVPHESAVCLSGSLRKSIFMGNLVLHVLSSYHWPVFVGSLGLSHQLLAKEGERLTLDAPLASYTADRVSFQWVKN